MVMLRATSGNVAMIALLHSIDLGGVDDSTISLYLNDSWLYFSNVDFYMVFKLVMLALQLQKNCWQL